MKRIVAVVAVLFTSLMLQAADTAPATNAAAIPPGEPQAKERLSKSPRHGEFVDLSPAADGKPALKGFIVYPERADKAPVVVVIMEIYGLSDWLRATCDQLAADGFIAIAPDFLSGKGPNGGGTEAFATRDDVTRAIRTVKPEEVMAGIKASKVYGLKLPSANGKFATVGFCWGGGQSFAYAALDPELSAAGVFYGTPPADAELPKIKAPVFGFYGKADARVTATVEPTVPKMKDLKKVFEPHIYDGAAHGFMRSQGPDRPADLKAAQEAWPVLVKFLTENTKADAK